ncbi:inositol monophosphatase family protein [Brevibacterium album]|uniref:inositol monophosphatase family protein n=1 Tax=Brevibacterium album TaxID=417948 RepID=UPI0003FC05FC|nr:inositol monophosphatase family protein [Brevibacterium album]
MSTSDFLPSGPLSARTHSAGGEAASPLGEISGALPCGSVLLRTDPLLSAAREAAVIAVHRMEHWAHALGAGSVDSKDGRNNLVTVADAEIEALVRGRLLDLRPGDVMVGEENSASLSLDEHAAGAEIRELLHGGGSGPADDLESSGRFEWHVDPIDGTVNFVRGIEHYCFSVGVRVLPGTHESGDADRAGSADEPVTADADAGWTAGLVAAPALGRIWFAREGRAWTAPLAALTDPDVEARPLTGASAPTSGRVVATGFGYAPERRAQQLASLALVMEEFDDIRRCGSAALDLCMAAEGRVNAYYERGLGVYDFAGGAYIAQSAGRYVRRRRDAFAPVVHTGAPTASAGEVPMGAAAAAAPDSGAVHVGTGDSGVGAAQAGRTTGVADIGAPELTVVADTRERFEFLLAHG